MPDETGLSIRSVWEQVADGTLPAPIQIGPRAVGWLADEIEEWRQKKRRERDARLAKGLPAHNIPTSESPLKRPRGRPRKSPAIEVADAEAHA
ncbi:AlpA family phage regulatory protein [Mesorhizobium sp. M0571]